MRIQEIIPGRRGRTLARVGVLAVFALAAVAEPPESQTVHPSLWPAAKSPPLVDAATEARIAAIVKRMSLEEKVGQTIQSDISRVTPAGGRVMRGAVRFSGGRQGADDGQRESDRRNPKGHGFLLRLTIEQTGL